MHGDAIKSVSPPGDAPKAGWTRIVVWWLTSSGASRTTAFTASNSKTVFIKVTNEYSSRVQVSRNSFVRFWHEKGRSCEVKWRWRALAGKRVRFLQQISLSDREG